jgi:VWFA-related protein
VTLRAEASAPVGVARVTLMADGKPVCSREAPPYECTWDAGDGVHAHVIRALALLRDGSRRVASVRTRAATLLASVDVGVVQVTATVTDAQGRFVKGLGREAFRIYENGVPQPITHFVGPGGAKELVAAVDISASMAEAMPRLREAVRSFLTALLPEDRVTLLAFNDNLFTLARREVDPEQRARVADRLAPWGRTALYDAVLHGLGLLARQKGRKALVVFTDGDDQASHASVADVERRVEVNDAPIYMIGQGRGTDVKELREVLDGMARISGGRAFHTDKIEELQGAFAEIAEELANQYLLAYDPTDSARDGTWRTIKVELAGSAARVRARQGYRAVASTGEGETGP